MQKAPERDLEDAILRDIEQCLLEMGAGFTFVSRQKRLQIDDDDFYIDLPDFPQIDIETRKPHLGTWIKNQTGLVMLTAAQSPAFRTELCCR